MEVSKIGAMKNIDSQMQMATAEAAVYLGLCVSTLNAWRSQGRAGSPAYLKMGRTVRYRKIDLDRYLEKSLVEHK